MNSVNNNEVFDLTDYINSSVVENKNEAVTPVLKPEEALDLNVELTKNSSVEPVSLPEEKSENNSSKFDDYFSKYVQDSSNNENVQNITKQDVNVQNIPEFIDSKGRLYTAVATEKIKQNELVEKYLCGYLNLNGKVLKALNNVNTNYQVLVDSENLDEYIIVPVKESLTGAKLSNGRDVKPLEKVIFQVKLYVINNLSDFTMITN